MSFLLDTNIVSEWAKPRPSARVMHWLSEVEEAQVFLSVVSLGEIQHGVDALPAKAAKRDRLQAWLTDDLITRFDGRLLSVDVETALIWGRITARSKAIGRTIGVVDGFIAATAVRHQLTLVTRNVADFERSGIRLPNPWQD